jgi:glycosidase
VMCVDDVEYPAQPDASGQISAELGLSEGRHRLFVQAQDSGGFTSSQAWTYFIVNRETHAPIADPGPTRFVRVGTEVILDGANSRDPDGDDITTYNWKTVDATVSFDASTLPDGRVTLAEGYRTASGQLDPNAMPATTPARKLYTPTQPGISTVRLDVADAHGASTNTDNLTQVVALPTVGPRPTVQLALAVPAFGPVSVDAAASQRSSTATFKWLADVKNPASFDLAPFLKNGGSRLELPRSRLGEGVWRFYVWIEDGGGASWPGGAQITNHDGVLRIDDAFLAPKWAYAGAIDELFVRKFNDTDGDGIGDLQGVTQKLDYLAGLGIKTLWLMPIFRSNDHDHGYHAVDYFDIEPDFGTRKDLTDLLREAHKRGLKVILDLAINHTSRRHPLFKRSVDAFVTPAGPGAWLRDWYVWFDNMSSSLVDKYGWGRELGGDPRLSLATGWADIPDVNFGHPELRHYMFDAAKYWVDPNGDGDFSDGVDGYRLDHVTGPDHSVWASFRSEMKALNPDLLLIGEVFRGFDNDQGYGIKDYYHGELDAAFTFPFYFQFDAMWSSNAGPAGLHDLVSQLQTDRFPVGALHVSFLENHDVPNPPVFAKYGPDKLKLGLVLEAALPPVPQAIWGQELGLAEYRGFTPWSKEGPANDLENHFRAVMSSRRDEPALREGSFAWAGTNMEGQAVAIVRQLAGSPTIIAVANDAASSIDSLDVDLSEAGPGTSLKPIVGQSVATIDAGRHMHLSLPAFGTAIYELNP